jgi:hypothetical protein
MGTKLWFTGATLLLAESFLYFIPVANVVGAIFMILGTILIWLDK